MGRLAAGVCLHFLVVITTVVLLYSLFAFANFTVDAGQWAGETRSGLCGLILIFLFLNNLIALEAFELRRKFVKVLTDANDI